MALAYLAILCMLLEYILFMTLVGYARSWYKISAPATTGHPDFERYFRVQQNTLEQLIVVIPALWIMADTLSVPWAALFGFGFIVARAFYAWGYYKSAAGRHWGFVACSWASGGLMIGAGLGVVRQLFLHP